MGSQEKIPCATKYLSVESRDSGGIQETRTMGGRKYHDQQPVSSPCEERLGVPPSDASLASYLQNRKKRGKTLSPADEKFLQACHQPCKPVTGFWPQNEAAIADFVKKPWPFGDLPEKVSSLASYCRKRKQQGLPLTTAQERFFEQLVNVHKDVKNEGLTMVLF